VLRDRDFSPVASTARFVRRPLVRSLARALLTSTLVVALYFLLPLRPDRPASYLWLCGGLLLLGVLVVWQVLQIMAARHPRLRAIEAMATTLPLYLVLFATVHYLLGQNQPDSYSQPLSRMDALYFVVTVFATVGFGDIVPTNETTRIVTTVQMVLNLVFVGVIARVLLGAMQEGLRRQRSVRAENGEPQLPVLDQADRDAGPDDAARR
jgi:voltage-gated potassium channel